MTRGNHVKVYLEMVSVNIYQFGRCIWTTENIGMFIVRVLEVAIS